MDSLTQVVLGAAVGEAALGKKIGNRAIVWGGIAGTIPDLDVLGNAFMTPVEALAFHRGITHALVFFVIAAPIFAWLTHQFYRQHIYKQQTYKTTVSMLFSIVFVGLFGTLNYVSLLDGAPSVPLLLITLITGYFFFRRVWNYWRKPTIEIDMSNTSIKDWSILFGLGFLTHTLLDACTPFGTQLFQPFSNVRISFDTIAVIDPLYTVPFLICLILAAFYHRGSSRRRFFNWLGIGLSCAYLAFTFYNQYQMENKFKALLEERNVNYNQVSVVPTIFNNALWQCVAETDTNYVFTNYSVFDKNLDKIKLVSIEKNHALLAAYESDKEIKILKWFSKGYYNVEQQADGSLKYNDLKIAVISEDIFGELYFGMNYTISEAGSGIVISENREIEFPEGMFQRFWTRIKGYK